MSPAGFVNHCFEAMVSKIGQTGDSKMYELLQFYDRRKGGISRYLKTIQIILLIKIMRKRLPKNFIFMTAKKRLKNDRLS
ncbi:hypothetical protein TUM17559_48310 [Enterobacter cloacae]|nr:hypothetical protein TUM17559_48310 [Enterobacter cloacae]GJL14325.1 hypothetical protein TUM17572_41320 [Klebsiella oxytoca]